MCGRGQELRTCGKENAGTPSYEMVLVGYQGSDAVVDLSTFVPTVIGDDAFSGNEDLTQLVIPTGVRTVGARAFADCTHLVCAVLPDTVTVIGEDAFRFCRSLHEVQLPSTIKSISARTFKRCGSLRAVWIPDGVTTIEAEAFAYCGQLQQVRLPATLHRIEARAFAECPHLDTVNIPEEITYVAPDAFMLERCKPDSNNGDQMRNIPYPTI